MQAIEISKHGGPEVLELVDVPIPAPANDELLVRVNAAGVNYTDAGFRDGTFTCPLPMRLGKEACGIVEALGRDVSGFKVGDRVAATLLDGAYAEFVTGPAKLWVHVPDAVNDALACTAMMQGLTAHYLTHDVFALRPGSVALFTAATSGVNAFAMPMAKGLGATVIAIVSSAEKKQLAHQNGADFVIDSSSSDVVKEIKSLTKGNGVDVVYDSVGPALFPLLLSVVKPRGAAVLYGAASGKLTALDTKDWLFYSINAVSPSIENYIEDRAELLTRARSVFDGIIAGTFNLSEPRVFPLAAAREAHESLADKSRSGKIVLVPKQNSES